MFWVLKMIAQMEFVTKGDFETVALYFRIILSCFFLFFRKCKCTWGSGLKKILHPEKKKSLLPKKTKTSSKENSSLQKENSTIQEDNSLLQEKNSSLQKENSLLQEENSSSKDENSSSKDENSSSKDENSSLNGGNHSSSEEDYFYSDEKDEDDKDDDDEDKDKDDIDKDEDLDFDKEAVEVVANANSNFGNALFKILAKPKENLIMSSFSVSMVLNMLLNGAKGKTASQLKKGLTMTQERKRWVGRVGNYDVVKNGFKYMVKNGFKDVLTLLKTHKSFTLNAANRIYYSGVLGKSYLQSTKEFFLAEPIGMNFGQAEKSRNAINQWVEEQTNKKIQELIAPGLLDANTKLVLVNAIYFKGDWEFKFDKSKTRKGDFHVSPTQKVQTDMMNSSGTYGVLRGINDLEGADALDMPYKGKRLSMIFLLPAKQGPTCRARHCRPTASEEDLEDLEEAMSKVTDLNSILKFEQESAVEVTLPRFKLESELDLVEPLKQLGMTNMFDAKADFSGMTGGTNNSLYVGVVKQKAFVEVNEEGAEAAAATFATVQSRSSKHVWERPKFTCDRPFMFLIRDNLTGMILFSGHVTDPSK